MRGEEVCLVGGGGCGLTGGMGRDDDRVFPLATSVSLTVSTAAATATSEVKGHGTIRVHFTQNTALTISCSRVHRSNTALHQVRRSNLGYGLGCHCCMVT